MHAFVRLHWHPGSTQSSSSVSSGTLGLAGTAVSLHDVCTSPHSTHQLHSVSPSPASPLVSDNKQAAGLQQACCEACPRVRGTIEVEGMHEAASRPKLSLTMQVLVQVRAAPGARPDSAAASTTARWLATVSRPCPLRRGAQPRLPEEMFLKLLAWIPVPALLLRVLLM